MRTNFILALPDDLYHQILAYNEIVDQIEFARVNTRVCHLLMRGVRDISLVHLDKINLLLQSQNFREKVLSMIKSPLKQLNIHDYEENVFSDLPVLSSKDKDLPCLAFNTIDCSYRLYRAFVPYQVQHLTLKMIYSEDVGDWDEVEFCAMLRDKLTLTSLSLIGTIESELISYIPPVIPTLRSLYLSELPRLTSEGLYISEFSNLSGRSKEGIKPPNMKLLTNGKSFSLSMRKSDATMINALFLPDSSSFSSYSLRVLKLDGITNLFSIPPDHQIQELEVNDCPGLLSCANMGSIPLFSLIKLLIASLVGLGTGNCKVLVEKCDNIEDFSQLQHCDEVTIDQCLFFKDAQVLKGVRAVTYIPSQVYRSVEFDVNLDGVTHIRLSNQHDTHVMIYPFLLKFKSITTFSCSELCLRTVKDIEDTLSCFCEYRHLKTLSIDNGFCELLTEKVSLEQQQNLMREFEIFHHTYTGVVLRRKE
eukprot:gene3873-4136_t